MKASRDQNMLSQTRPIKPRFLDAGDTAVVIEFGDRVDRAVSARVLALSRRVDGAAIAGVIETVPTFRSLMVHYDPLATTAASVREQLSRLIDDTTSTTVDGRLWHLPLCYDRLLAPDLDEVAERTKLTPERVVALHSGTEFHVYTLGFLPGHPYLGDTPPELTLPRRDNPRIHVPAGSIAIAMNLCSMYPLDSPGGWHIIGRTPVRIFDPRRTPSILLAPNDKIRFLPIGLEAYEQQAEQAVKGTIEIAPQSGGITEVS